MPTPSVFATRIAYSFNRVVTRDLPEDESELVAPEACHGVALPYASSESLSYRSKHFVSDRMAEPIVDLLETVEIEKEDAELEMVPPSMSKGHRQRSKNAFRLGRPVRAPCMAR